MLAEADEHSRPTGIGQDALRRVHGLRGPRLDVDVRGAATRTDHRPGATPAGDLEQEITVRDERGPEVRVEQLGITKRQRLPPPPVRILGQGFEPRRAAQRPTAVSAASDAEPAPQQAGCPEPAATELAARLPCEPHERGGTPVGVPSAAERAPVASGNASEDAAGDRAELSVED